MSKTISAIVTGISKDATTLMTENGHEVVLPRYFGESPAKDSTVI